MRRSLTPCPSPAPGRGVEEWIPAFAGMTIILIIGLAAIVSQAYYRDGVTVNGPHGDYTTMRGEDNCGTCHLATTTAWAILPHFTCIPTPTFRQTTCFKVGSSWGWQGSFNAGRRYLDASCLSCHNTAGMGTPKMTLQGNLLSILNGPAPLYAYSIATGLPKTFKCGSTLLSNGPPLYMFRYQCTRCHDPHFENHTGLNYLKAGVQ